MASTFLTSIPAALILYDPVLSDTDYILGAGDDARVTLGALLEIFLMIRNVGTAVVMFPILRRYSETLSLSYVASRTIPVRTGILRRRQRHPARLADVPDWTDAATARATGRHRRSADLRVLDRGPVRRLRAGRPARAVLGARGRLRGGVCDLPDRQGLPASPILDDARFGGRDGGSLRPAAAP